MASTAAPEVSVSTVAATATSTGHHMLKIDGYRHLKRLHGNGEYFESCRFAAAGHTWKIRCYPNALGASYAGYFSIYLVLDDDEESAGAVVHAEFRFALVYPSSWLLPWPPYSKIATATYSSLNKCWGFPRFITLNSLEISAFLKDGCLAVRCDITVIEESAVKDELVTSADMERLGMFCECKDDLCKRQHRAETGNKLRKAFARFFSSIGG